jgi:hypothetical protein
MNEQDSSPSWQPEPQSQANANSTEDTQGYLSDMRGQTLNAVPFFPVIDHVTFKPLTVAPKREAWYLPTGMARLVSAIGLSAALLGPLSSCSSPADCTNSNKTINANNGQTGIGTTNTNCYGGS